MAASLSAHAVPGAEQPVEEVQSTWASAFRSPAAQAEQQGRCSLLGEGVFRFPAAQQPSKRCQEPGSRGGRHKRPHKATGQIARGIGPFCNTAGSALQPIAAAGPREGKNQKAACSSAPSSCRGSGLQLSAPKASKTFFHPIGHSGFAVISCGWPVACRVAIAVERSASEIFEPKLRRC